jgi:hypothetical protein
VAAVLLIIQRRTASPAQYQPLATALKRAGTIRLLNHAWLFDDAAWSVESVRQALSVYLPCDDGVVIAEVESANLHVRNPHRVV